MAFGYRCSIYLKDRSKEEKIRDFPSSSLLEIYEILDSHKPTKKQEYILKAEPI